MQFDIRTLLVSEVVVCLMLTAVMALMARHHQFSRGLRYLAVGFLATAGGVSIFMMRSLFPYRLDVLLSNSLYCVSILSTYVGISLLLAHGRPRLRWPLLLAVLSDVLLAAHLDAHHVAYRIMVITVADVVLRSFLLVTLFRHLRRGAPVKLLAGFLGFFMAGDVARVIGTYFFGAPADVFAYNAIQTAYIASSLLANCAFGVFGLALAAEEMARFLEKKAHRDPLTGVLNRLGLELRLEQELKRCRDERVPLCLAVLDIDDFKEFNSRGGHAMGDDVLRQIATCVGLSVRSTDASGRMGGDEFVVVFPDTPHGEAETICRRVLHAVETQPERAGAERNPTVSIGLTQAEESDSTETMLARADRALYAAKHSGKNRVAVDLPPQ
jgi:diguanylate cyclase (GGDEF)-like protein